MLINTERSRRIASENYRVKYVVYTQSPILGWRAQVCVLTDENIDFAGYYGNDCVMLIPQFDAYNQMQGWYKDAEEMCI